MNERRKPLSVAMVGAGQVSRFHLAGWAEIPDARIGAIYNRSPARARERAAEFGIPRVYDDLAEMLDRETLDAVDIVAGPQIHATATRMAAERGLAVMCQKPLAGSLDAAIALVEEIGARIPFMVHENWRFRPQYRQIAEWVKSGRIGKVCRFAFTASSSGLLRTMPDSPPPLLQRQPFIGLMPRMIVLELLIHHLDTIRFLTGQNLAVAAAVLRRRSADVVGEDLACILLDGADGAAGTVAGDFCVPGAPSRILDRLDLVGDRGRIVFEDNIARLIGAGDEDIVLSFDSEAAYQASYTNTIAHFARSLHEGTTFETSARDNLATLALVEEAYRAGGK